MKKICLLIMLMLLTGCSNILKGDLVTTCTIIENSSSLQETKVYTINFKQGEITNITLNDKFLIEDDNIDILSAIESYKRAYQNEQGVIVTNTSNEIIYEFDLKEVSKQIKQDFNLASNYNEQISKLKEKGAICE